mmetsp:Transcript_11981/g.12063  ORF Transcript_11981/g.12063 Transcript_11981/m.12063 type:complete len:287 (+) Transcript_11981:12-872(+)
MERRRSVDISDKDLEKAISTIEELNEMINHLEQQRVEQEENGDYLEADISYHRILQLRKTVAEKQRSALKSRQSTEMIEVETNHSKEYSDLVQAWQNAFSDYKQSCKETEALLIAKQQTEFEEEKKRLENTVPMIPKHSPEYLNLSKILQTLVRNKNYQEAHRIRNQLNNLDCGKSDEWQEERTRKIELKLDCIRRRHEKELENAKQKVRLGFEELKKKQAAEFAELAKRYQNLKKSLTNQQKLQANKLNDTTKRRGTMDVKNLARMLSKSNLTSRIISREGSKLI